MGIPSHVSCIDYVALLGAVLNFPALSPALHTHGGIWVFVCYHRYHHTTHTLGVSVFVCLIHTLHFLVPNSTHSYFTHTLIYYLCHVHRFTCLWVTLFTVAYEHFQLIRYLVPHAMGRWVVPVLHALVLRYFVLRYTLRYPLRAFRSPPVCSGCSGLVPHTHHPTHTHTHSSRHCATADTLLLLLLMLMLMMMLMIHLFTL